MEFALTAEQADVQSAARHFLARTYPPSRVAEFADGLGSDIGSWPELVEQGWLDPDLGLVELALLAEENGRALHPAPWWATVALALPVYRTAQAQLPGAATLADGTDGAGRAHATHQAGQWRLDGTVPDVVDAGVATEIVVAAETSTGLSLFGLRREEPGVSLNEGAGIDPLRSSPELTMVGARARLLVGPPLAAELLTEIGARATTLLSCEAVGVADRALEIAVEHARTRVQFGRPVGSFQAVSQLLADCYAELELARSLAYRAACVLRDDPAAASDAVACAALSSSRAAVNVCEAAIQVCGGMGVTWEFPLHRWFRRALWLEAALANRQDPLTTIAGALFEGRAAHRAGTAVRTDTDRHHGQGDAVR